MLSPIALTQSELDVLSDRLEQIRSEYNIEIGFPGYQTADNRKLDLEVFKLWYKHHKNDATTHLRWTTTQPNLSNYRLVREILECIMYVATKIPDCPENYFRDEKFCKEGHYFHSSRTVLYVRRCDHIGVMFNLVANKQGIAHIDLYKVPPSGIIENGEKQHWSTWSRADLWDLYEGLMQYKIHTPKATAQVEGTITPVVENPSIHDNSLQTTVNKEKHV